MERSRISAWMLNVGNKSSSTTGQRRGDRLGSALCNSDFSLRDVLKGFGTRTWLRHSHHTVEQIKKDSELKGLICGECLDICCILALSRLERMEGRFCVCVLAQTRDIRVDAYRLETLESKAVQTNCAC